jgi:hypothetical protein
MSYEEGVDAALRFVMEDMDEDEETDFISELEYHEDEDDE